MNHHLHDALRVHYASVIHTLTDDCRDKGVEISSRVPVEVRLDGDRLEHVVMTIMRRIDMMVTITSPSPIWIAFWPTIEGGDWKFRDLVHTSGVVAGETVTMPPGRRT